MGEKGASREILVQWELTIDTETPQKAAPFLTQISRVMSRYTCPITACMAAAQWGNHSHCCSCLFFSPMIALHELSRGRRGFDIKSSLQIVIFSVPGWLVRDFVSFRSRCWGSCIESFLAPSSQCSWGDIGRHSGLWIPTQISRNWQSPFWLWDTKPGVPRQCQKSTSLLSSLLCPRGGRLVWSVKNKVVPALWGVKRLGVQALTWNSSYKMYFLSCNVLYFSCSPI